MKAVILPTAKTEDLAPLTTWMPEFLLPVVNKPVVEHLIELLVRHGVKEILLVLKHMPYETEQYFGDGSRWGARLSYSLLTRYRGIADALGRMESSRLEGPLICLPGDLVTDLDLCGFMDARCRGPGSIVSARPVALSSDPGLSGARAGEAEGLDACPLFLSGEALPSLSALGAPGTPGFPGEGVSVYPISCGYERIRSPADLVRVNRRVIEGGFRGILLPGKEIEPGIRVGRHCRMHPRARLEAPVLIGSHCDIQGGSVVGPGSVVGDHVIVDERASIEDSVVLDRTYVGVHARIQNALVRKNWMLQTPTMLEVYLADDLILGDLEKGTLSTQAGRLLNLFLALGLLVLTSPLWVVFLLYHFLLPSKKVLDSQRRLCACGQMSLAGVKTHDTFELFYFKSRNRLIRKLPGLINVIRGDLNLVGVSTLTEEEMEKLPEEWKSLREKAPLGLFHLWELEKEADLGWEEKRVADSYYAVTRTTWGDVKILGKVLPATLLG